MAANPTAYLFYGVILDAPDAVDLADDDAYVALEEALEEHEVQLLHFGETPDIQIALAIARSVITASSGSAEVVRSLDVGQSWDAKLARACEMVDIPTKKPAWYVTSRVSW